MILAIFSFVSVLPAEEQRVIEPTYMVGSGLTKDGPTARDLANTTAKLSAERRSQFHCVPESLLVSYVGEVTSFTDADCDGVAEYVHTIWSQRAGRSLEFGYLVQDQDRTIHSSTTRGLISIDPTYQKNQRLFGKEIEAAMIHTSQSLFDPKRTGDFFLIGGEGPLIEKEVLVEQDEKGEVVREILVNTAVNPYLGFGPQNCLDFAWHKPTQSLLCIGEWQVYDDEEPVSGLWVIPRKLSGQLDWERPRFFWSISENVKYAGLAADETGVYLFIVATDQSGPLATSWLVHVTLQRNGHEGPFGAAYHVISHDLADPTVRQPIAIAKEGLRVVLASYWGNQVTHDIYHVSRDGQKVRPFALGFGKPGGMVVQKIRPGKG